MFTVLLLQFGEGLEKFQGTKILNCLGLGV
jgi:hypothetical protein